jgi:cytochrome c biogenesis protein CcmG/thiol:disulfide interchange protein DsbE
MTLLFSGYSLSEKGVNSALRFLYFMPFVAFMLLMAGFMGGLMHATEAPASAWFASTRAIEGETIPDFSVESLLSEKEFKSEVLKRNRYVVVNIFASWCASCMDEHELLMEIYNSHSVPVYGINWRDEPAAAKAWLEKYGNPYKDIASDKEGEVAIHFGITGAPETFLIGPGGKIIFRHAGVLTREVLEKDILPKVQSRR